jgi:hypothetical protein
MPILHNSRDARGDIPKRSSALDMPLTTTVAVSLAGIAVIACIGLLFTRLLHRDFLGQQTRLIHECKKNPAVNPELCAPILEARAVDVHPSPRAFRDPKLQRGFSISGIDDEIHVLGTP